MDSEALSPSCLSQIFLAIFSFCLFPAMSWIASFLLLKFSSFGFGRLPLSRAMVRFMGTIGLSRGSSSPFLSTIVISFTFSIRQTTQISVAASHPLDKDRWMPGSCQGTLKLLEVPEWANNALMKYAPL